MSFTADVGRPRQSSKDVEEDRLTALTEQQMSIRATPCVGYWAAYYINRDGGWSVACDALGRIIRCETEKLALSVARYRRRRLQPLQGENPNLARTERRNGRDGAGRAVEIRGFPSLARTSGLAVRQPPIFVPNTASWKYRKVHPDMMHKLPANHCFTSALVRAGNGRNR